MNKEIKECLKENLLLAKERLKIYLKAEKAILSGQSYEIGDRKLTRANLKDVTDMINSLRKEITLLSGKLNGVTRVKINRPIW